MANVRALLDKLGIDDSGWAIPFPDEADYIVDHSDEGGPIVIVTYNRDPEACRRAKRNLMSVANQVIDRLSSSP